MCWASEPGRYEGYLPTMAFVNDNTKVLARESTGTSIRDKNKLAVQIQPSE